MERLLTETFRPALEASIAGPLVTAIAYRDYPSNNKYWAIATLTYRGKKWVRRADGKWIVRDYELLAFRYVAGATLLLCVRTRGPTWGGVPNWSNVHENKGRVTTNARSDIGHAAFVRHTRSGTPNVCVPLLLRGTARRGHLRVR
jgi:hypothetical protein